MKKEGTDQATKGDPMTRRAEETLNSIKIQLTLSFPEVLALCIQLRMGKMFMHQEEAAHVGKVLEKMRKKLLALGLDEKSVRKLVNL